MFGSTTLGQTNENSLEFTFGTYILHWHSSEFSEVLLIEKTFNNHEKEK